MRLAVRSVADSAAEPARPMCRSSRAQRTPRRTPRLRRCLASRCRCWPIPPGIQPKQLDVYPACARLRTGPPTRQQAAAENVGGEVTLLLLIDEAGPVRGGLRGRRRSPQGYFEAAALAAFRSGALRARRKDGRQRSQPHPRQSARSTRSEAAPVSTDCVPIAPSSRRRPVTRRGPRQRRSDSRVMRQREAVGQQHPQAARSGASARPAAPASAPEPQ